MPHRELSIHYGIIKIQALFCELWFPGMVASWQWLSAPISSPSSSLAYLKVPVHKDLGLWLFPQQAHALHCPPNVLEYPESVQCTYVPGLGERFGMLS